MRIENVIGFWLTEARKELGWTQTQVGARLGDDGLLGRTWARQSVSAAEKGERAFTAAELVAFSILFERPVQSLLMPPPGIESIELGDGPPTDAKWLRAAAASGTDVPGIVDALHRLSEHLPALQNELRELERLVVRGSSWRWVETTGGLVASQDQMDERA